MLLSMAASKLQLPILVGSLPKSKTREVFLNSAFVPAPRGDFNLATFRLWEALISGAIPIVADETREVEETYFEPFPRIARHVVLAPSWNAMPPFLADLYLIWTGIDARRLALVDWWCSYVKDLRRLIRSGVRNWRLFYYVLREGERVCNGSLR